MEAASLAIDSEWIFRIINTVEAGYHAAGQLLELAAEKRPSAIVCLADIMAIGAMNRVTLAGLEINRDIAITGFDDTPMSEFLHPPLTTVRQPVELAGQRVVELVLAQFVGKSAIEKHVLLKPELVVRGSA
jgi:LacI family repressor for deo operon, udp, cdd, tsx, nupC, and nupG